MRILVFFDLPVKTQEERKKYRKFRVFLLKDGYNMLQFSIYCRLCNGMDHVNKHLSRLGKNIPPEGCIRSLCITEKQYNRMKIWLGNPTAYEKKISGNQLVLF